MANWPPRIVGWHTLYCTDLYLDPSEEAWSPGELYWEGRGRDKPAEPPGLSAQRTLEYADFCIAKMQKVVPTLTMEQLSAPTGFERGFSVGEMHVYNIRHIQHHTGQLSAHVRRLDPNTPAEAMDWIDSGLEWPPGTELGS